ncbi:hypothetical protein [Ferruginibacter profundus]
MVKFIGFSIIFLTYFIIDGLVKHKRKKDRFYLPGHVKEHYKELIVPANKVEVLGNEYLEEVETGGSMQYKAAESLYDNGRNFTKELKFASVLVYYDSRRGKKIRLHSETIDLGPNQLQSLINSKGSISIFFDRNNPGNYYFDLSFLAG